MAGPAWNETFKSWRRALEAHQLTTEQLGVLEDMVREGEAGSVKTAADIRDWHENVLNPDEHMWGS